MKDCNDWMELACYGEFVTRGSAQVVERNDRPKFEIHVQTRAEMIGDAIKNLYRDLKGAELTGRIGEADRIRGQISELESELAVDESQRQTVVHRHVEPVPSET